MAKDKKKTKKRANPVKAFGQSPIINSPVGPVKQRVETLRKEKKAQEGGGYDFVKENVTIYKRGQEKVINGNE